MKDRKAVRIPAPVGRPQFEGEAPAVVVVGGGIAGLAAATLLAERGARVVLCERETYLGGRVGGWATRLADGSEVTMTRGFHAFFRQYYNLRALLKRVDPSGSALVGLPDYPLQHATGHRDGFAGLPTSPPWNALAFLRSSPTFRWRDLPDINGRAAMSLFDVAVPRVYEELDGIDAVSYLESIQFPEAAHALAFEVFSRSFFAHPSHMSAAELAVMFHIYFLGSSEGLLFDVAADPFPHGLWEPLARRLTSMGATVCTGVEVGSVRPGQQKRFSVAIGGGFVEADAVVIAADVSGLRTLVEASPSLGNAQWRQRVGELRTAPRFLVSRYWLDRPVDIDRPGFLGTSGYGLLDNISVLNHYEHEARAWAARAGGSVVELHGYALPSDVDESDARVRLWEQLIEVYPELKGAKVIDERHELRDDCPLFPAGGYTRRPTVRTPDEFLFSRATWCASTSQSH